MPRVVVIDDSRLIRDLLTLGLSKAGFDVTAAPGVDEGLLVIRSTRPDIVLLDLEMPDKDGLACLEVLRASPTTHHLPVIMISAHPAREVILRVAHMGVKGVIVKSDNLLWSYRPAILAAFLN